MHKSEFTKGKEGLNHEFEYKFKYDRANYFISMLNSSKKCEIEAEVEPKALSTADRFVKLRAKQTFTPNPHPELNADKKCCEWLKYWDLRLEQENKLSFMKELGHTVKLDWDVSRTPRAIFTTLFNRKPLLMGVNYTFDYEMPKYSGNFEVLLGARPYQQWITYIKQYPFL